MTFNLITSAFAQGSDKMKGSDSFGILFPIIAMILIFYFLLIRPQQKKEKARKSMISAIKKGDKVLTVGGIYGVVVNEKDDDTVILKIADGTKVEFSKASIQSKVS
ncbi:MAG: preprotein translocase subunit YajC [Spirochaetota bacterium]|nr:preprotein translocase subunit YajC [Spirochaetota bacterium]